MLSKALSIDTCSTSKTEVKNGLTDTKFHNPKDLTKDFSACNGNDIALNTISKKP